MIIIECFISWLQIQWNIFLPLEPLLSVLFRLSSLCWGGFDQPSRDSSLCFEHIQHFCLYTRPVTVSVTWDSIPIFRSLPILKGNVSPTLLLFPGTVDPVHSCVVLTGCTPLFIGWERGLRARASQAKGEFRNIFISSSPQVGSERISEKLREHHFPTAWCIRFFISFSVLLTSL